MRLRELLAVGMFAVCGCGGRGCGGDEDLLLAPLGVAAASTGTAAVCVPSATVACVCPDGVNVGAQTCLDEGSGFGVCEGCGGASSSSSGEGGAGVGGEGGAGGGGGSAPECTTAADCPATGSECTYPTCTALSNKCDVAPSMAGKILMAQVAGDCVELQCDGAGAVMSVFDGADMPMQTAGDCTALACDDQAQTLTETFDPNDPEDDGTQCTTDACTMMGTTTHEPATGTPCDEGGGAICNAGACVMYIPVKCKITDTGEVFQGCDGLSYPGLTIVWGNGQTFGQCKGLTTDVGYCPPGESCGAGYNGDPPKVGICEP